MFLFVFESHCVRCKFLFHLLKQQSYWLKLFPKNITWLWNTKKLGSWNHPKKPRLTHFGIFHVSMRVDLSTEVQCFHHFCRISALRHRPVPWAFWMISEPQFLHDLKDETPRVLTRTPTHKDIASFYSSSGWAWDCAISWTFDQPQVFTETERFWNGKHQVPESPWEFEYLDTWILKIYVCIYIYICASLYTYTIICTYMSICINTSINCYTVQHIHETTTLSKLLSLRSLLKSSARHTARMVTFHRFFADRWHFGCLAFAPLQHQAGPGKGGSKTRC